MSQIERFNFHGSELDVIVDGEDVWISVRRVCEALGLTHQSQFNKLKSATWATVTQRVTVAEDGKVRETFVIHLRSLAGWLQGIDAWRVSNPVVRTKIELFQREAADVLANHFLRQKEADPVALLLKKSPAELLQLAADLAREGELAKHRAAAAEAEIAVLAPKAEVADRIAEGDEVLSLAHAAKNLAIGPKALNDALIQGAILFRDARGNLVPYQIHINTGRFVVRQSPYRHPKTGETRYSATTLVTQKGLVWLAERLAPASSARPVANLPLFAKGGR